MTIQDHARRLDPTAFAETLAYFGGLGLISTEEADEALALFDPDFPFADAVRSADSIHLHVKVADVDALSHPDIVARGTAATSCIDGYIKYPFPGGINMIFSSIPISEDDMLDESVSACAASHAVDDGDGTVSSSYYERGDLGHFADVGRYAQQHMERFFAYYTGVFGEDGALTRREKALIGLAVAHSKQCPYCIDSFTSSCIDLDISPDQMHEAVHAAASLGAGIDLVHGVQMQNVLKLRHVID